MRRIVIATAMSLCVVSLPAMASADTLMRDGTRIEGMLTGSAAGTITFRRAYGTSRRYPASEVEALEFRPARSSSSGRRRRVARRAAQKWRWTSGLLPSTGGDT